MSIATKLASLAVLASVLVVIARVPAQTRSMRAVRSLLIVLVAASPLLFDHRPRTLVQTCFVMLFLGLERLLQRAPYNFTSQTHVRNATYLVLVRAIYLAVGYYWLDSLAGNAVPWGLEANRAPVWLQAIAIFLAVDLARYVTHYLQHRLDFWWRCHRIHHSSTELSALAAYPNHLIDGAFDGAFVVLIIPSLVGYLLGVRADVFLFASSIPAAILANSYAHANINFPKTRAWWAYLVTSPNAHAHHHTRAHARSNLGNVLLVWDWMFGTLEIPEQVPSDFGIDDPRVSRMGILEQTLAPFGLGGPSRLDGLKPAIERVEDPERDGPAARGARREDRAEARAGAVGGALT
jgi:sterol desaturase/sphingolipid hydroxylase (fatty acid hydroxylase superfamily)